MKIKISYLIRISVSFSILLLPLYLESKELDYEFSWFYTPVAFLSINFNELPEQRFNDFKNSFAAEFLLSTEGPLKLYRNYSSNGYVRRKNSTSWDFYLAGNDRGQPEEKLITYFSSREPKIIKFTDDKGVQPMTVDPIFDLGALDPFSVLFKTIEQLYDEQNCQNEYTVMDGKRRYKINIEFIDKTDQSVNLKIDDIDTIYKCRLTMSNVEKNLKRWPFNSKKRSMIVWFSSNLKFKPVRFEFHTPIGKIVGKYTN